MQVSVETKEGIEKKLTVEFPRSDINGEVNSRLQSLTKTARINGFRPGKIPFSVIKKRYSGQVEAEVLNEKLQQSYVEAIKQENLTPAGQPEIKINDNDDKENISYTAVFEAYPEITLASLEGQTFEKAKVLISEDDIDSTVENIRLQHLIFNAVERAAQEGDQVVVDFVGTVDGETFKGNEGKQVSFFLGQGRMIEGFEDGIKGAKAGDSLTLDLKFPEEYHNKEVAGKDVQFAITVLEVKETLLPELNDEFYTKLGITGGSEAFREEVKKNMQMELDKAIAAKIKNQVMDVILELNDITVPKALVAEEAEIMAKQMLEQYQIQNPDNKLESSLFVEQAKQRVSLSLLLMELVKVNNITVSNETVMEKINEMAASYENPKEVQEYYLSNKDKLAEMNSFVLEEQVVKWVCEQGSVTEKEFSFTEFMNPEKEDKDQA